MWKFRRLDIDLRAMDAAAQSMVVLKDDGYGISELEIATYSLDENHILGIAVPPSQSVASHYALDNRIVNEMKGIAKHDAKVAIVAYCEQTKEVFLLDTVPAQEVAACVLLDVIKGAMQCGAETLTSRPSTMRIQGCDAARDSRGRFVRQVERYAETRKACQEDDSFDLWNALGLDD